MPQYFPNSPNYSSLFFVVAVVAFFNDRFRVTSKSGHISPFLSAFSIEIMMVSACPLPVSASLFLPFLHSLRGNLLGIAPLLSSPLSGCCRRCRPYSVCTQPGAPSNATSLMYVPHNGPNDMHTRVCVFVYVHPCVYWMFFFFICHSHIVPLWILTV